MRSDHGGEYTSTQFEEFCKEAGIKRELTTAYNPQQNGVAKRKNRTTMEAVKTMIHDQDLPIVPSDSRIQKKCTQERSQK